MTSIFGWSICRDSVSVKTNWRTRFWFTTKWNLFLLQTIFFSARVQNGRRIQTRQISILDGDVFFSMRLRLIHFRWIPFLLMMNLNSLSISNYNEIVQVMFVWRWHEYCVHRRQSAKPKSEARWQHLIARVRPNKVQRILLLEKILRIVQYPFTVSASNRK